MIVRTHLLEPGFYVTDTFAATLEAAVVSGPYASLAAADRALNDCNIAGDCEVVEIRPAVHMPTGDGWGDPVRGAGIPD